MSIAYHKKENAAPPDLSAGKGGVGNTPGPAPCTNAGQTRDEEKRAGSLYVHVPFCRSKCRYCDFYSVAMDDSTARAYVDAVLWELASCAGRLRHPLQTVFLGGGTPTVLGADLLARLLSGIGKFTGPETEVTVEANPGTVSPPVAAALVQSGVNRLSLGIQSFHDEELAFLGRIHTAEQAEAAVEELLQAGIANIGADLIYGICGQTLASWEETLRRTLGLPIRHLSCYALSIEAGTPLARDIQASLTAVRPEGISAAGGLAEMDDDAQKDCYLTAIDAARRAGMEQYEISNFSHPGFPCRHNLTYWRNEPYLGLGPGAASYLDGVRRKNRPDLRAYLTAIRAGRRPPASRERLAGRPAMAETLMLGLRMVQGVDRQVVAARFGLDPLEAFPACLARYGDMGAIVVTPEVIRLNPQYFFVSNTILADILAEASSRSV